MCFGSPNYGALRGGFLELNPIKRAQDRLTFIKSTVTNPAPHAPPLPPPPQAPSSPDTAPLSRRNAVGASFAVPSGSTLLSGPSGITAAQLNLGGQSLLGGG